MARASRRGWTNGIGPLMGRQLASLGIADKIREHTAPLIWAEMVGPQISSATEVEKVQDGILYITTRSSTWAQELTFHKQDILHRLNARLGATERPLITDLRFRNRAPKPKPTEDAPPAMHPTPEELEDIVISSEEIRIIEGNISVIADPDLRERVRKLRRTDARLRYWRMENGWTPCGQCGEMAPPRFPYDGTANCQRCRLARQIGLTTQTRY